MSDTPRPDAYVTTARIAAGVGSDVLLALARERAPDPSVFDERRPFFWLSEISNDRMDSYFGFMDAATTLVNFAADAAEGRAILAGHNSRVLPFGHSLTGTLERVEGRARVLSDAYTLRGLDLGGVSTDSFVDGVRAGVLRDISVGFTTGESGWFRCNVCGGDLMDWRACSHWPGMTYEVKGDDGVIRNVLATFTVIDARLSEYSAVYDGATPSAGILKIQDAARAGQVDDRARALLEARYRIRLPERRLVVPGGPTQEAGPRGAGAPTPEETPMDLAARLRGALGLPETAPDEEIAAAAEAAPAALREAAAAFGVAEGAEVAPALREIADALPALRQQAEWGRAYREETERAALAEAVRALGPEAEERYAATLTTLPLETVRQMRDDWRRIADAALPGGRRTVDRAEPAAPAPAEPSAITDAAYIA